MASLVLGVVGAAVGNLVAPGIGGMIGYAIGSAIGSAIDQPKVEGPRLTDLRLQSSSYGAFIPLAYGTIVVPGNIIWQTDLVEHKQTSGGKGGPEVTSYTYTASFAVALCEGPIVSVRRIWANKRIVYDTREGNEKVGDVPVTFYLGTENQLPDPTMEADKGVGNVPAHRGLAYAVFTDLELGEYGNAIPSFEFEVVTVGRGTAAVHRIKYLNGTGGPTYKGGYVPESLPACAIDAWTNNEIRVCVIDSTGTTNYFIEGDYNGLISLAKYDGKTLAYTGSKEVGPNYPTPRYYIQRSVFYPYIKSYQFRPCGLLGKMPIWVYRGPHTTGVSRTQQANQTAQILGLAIHWIISDEGDFAWTPRNILSDGGIPDGGVFVGGVAFTADRSKMFVFTAPTSDVRSGAAVIDTWYCFDESGAIIDQGTVYPLLDSAHLGFGAAGMQGGNVCAFEDNGRYMWWFEGANPVGTVTIYEIDPVTKVFAHNSVAGYCDWGDGSGAEVVGFHLPAIQPIGTGYCGFVAANSIGILSRLPLNTTDQIDLADVISDVSARVEMDPALLDVSQLDQKVTGYVVRQEGAARNAISALQSAYFFGAVESDGKVKFVKVGGKAVASIPQGDLAARHPDGKEIVDLQYVRQNEEELPRQVTVSYLNADAEYRVGSQYARREVTTSRNKATLQLDMSLTDTEAASIAAKNLYVPWVQRDQYSFVVPRKWSSLEPTDVVTVKGHDLLLVDKEESPDGTIKFSAVSAANLTSTGGIVTQKIASGESAGVVGAGTAGGGPIVAARATTDLHLLDLPLITDNDTPGIYVAMKGAPGAGAWSGAGLFRSIDGGTTYDKVLTVTSPCVTGVASTALEAWDGGNVTDETNSVTIVLEDGALTSVTQNALLNGANMAALGDEIIQYRTATLTAPLTYILTGLRRGRRGTEWATVHTAGERFYVLPLPVLPSADVGVLRKYKAVSNGLTLGGALVNDFKWSGVAYRPYAPVLLGGGVNASNDVTMTWVRRTRTGGQWKDLIDVPVGETTTQFMVQIWNSTYTTCVRQIITSEQQATYTAAQQTTDFGQPQRHVYFTVAQLGEYGYGRQAAGVAQGGASDTSPIVSITPYGQSSATTGTVNEPIEVDDLGSTLTRVVHGYWEPGYLWVLKFTTGPTAMNNVGHLVIAEYGGAPVMRSGKLSTTPGGPPIGPGCDLSGTTLSFNYFVVNNPFPLYAPTLQPNTTYYLTLSTSDQSSAFCDFIPPNT